MKRKICGLILSAIMITGSLSGCGSPNADKKDTVLTEKEVTEKGESGDGAIEVTDDQTEEEKPTIICTVFPEYDWVCQILGDKKEEYDVKLLLDSGVDIHSYQPTAEDIAEISTCDLFVYTGGVSESWIEETLESALNEEMQVVALMDVLGARVKTEEIVEGMEHTHEEVSADYVDAEDEMHMHESDVHEEDTNEEEAYETNIHEKDLHESTAFDEHIWLSLKNAKILAEELGNTLIALDRDNEAVFRENTDAYIEELTTLDDKYQKTVDAASDKTVLFGDRFPFRYLTDDYGLEYYAAFTGCSAETEASFETITFLAGKLDELKLPAVLVIESSDQKLAQTIISSTKERNQKILVMNSLQSVNSEDMATGVSYLSIMEENLDVLKNALGV